MVGPIKAQNLSAEIVTRQSQELRVTEQASAEIKTQLNKREEQQKKDWIQKKRKTH